MKYIEGLKEIKDSLNDGKALSEALLYIREDWENVTKQDMKSYFLSCFEPK